jgi:SAM-dependent methyltransferase
VVAGIPTFMPCKVGTAGQTIEEVVDLVRQRRHQEVLQCFLIPRRPPAEFLEAAWLRARAPLRRIAPLRRLACRGVLRRWRQQVESWLAQPVHDRSAQELLDYFYARAGRPTNYEYFAYRFGQPRHLVALSCHTLISRPRGPLLDLTCGAGHLTRNLVARANGQPVIGLDHNFFMLYLAKHWIAPEAEYVCAEAHLPLPFPDDLFSVVCCVDGFGFVQDKPRATQELLRVLVRDGLLMWIATRNALVPYERPGDPLPPEGYSALLGDMPHRILPDRDILTHYLQRLSPSLHTAPAPSALAEAPLITVVASRNTSAFRAPHAWDDWPHAYGQLGLNLHFRAEPSQGRPGQFWLRRHLPSDYYANDHPELAEFLPEALQVAARVLVDLRRGRRSAGVESLIDQLVVLGYPARYCS